MSVPALAGFKRFGRNRLIELAGLALVALAGAGLLAVMSYHGGDPSLNTAVSGPAMNWLGYPGALVADMLLQGLGLAVVPLFLAPASWGVQLLRHRRLPGLRWRLLLLPVPVAAAALLQAVSGLAVPAALPAGGALGVVLGHAVETTLASPPGWAVGLGAGLVLGLGVPYTSGLPAGRWLGRGLRSLNWPGLHWRGVGWRGVGWRGVGWRGMGWPTVNWLRLVSWPAARAGQREKERLTPRLEVHAAPPPDPAAPPGASPGANTATVAVATRPPDPDMAAPDGLQADEVARPYRLPPLRLLQEPSVRSGPALNEDTLRENARQLEAVLADFGVRGGIVKVRPGPVVTLYELEPAPGTKTSRVISLADDIARSMSALSVRIAVVPGRNVIGIELPNARREPVALRALLASAGFGSADGALNLALGKDIGGGPVIADLAKMPHLLIAGTTGSGKSVGVNAMILSLLFRLTPDECRFIMIDPKMLELSVYDGIPHLLSPVVTDPKKAVVALKWAVREMEDRYRLMSRLKVRNIAGYNQRLARAREKGEVLTRQVQTGFDADSGQPILEEQTLGEKPLPLIVLIVDEMADLMLVAGKDVEAAIQRLAQMARAAGIHLIMATQRPSVDVVTGTIKANFPTRISFRVTTRIDSRTILGEQGAEQLLGMGDMLHMDGGKITRVHGPFVSDREVEEIVAFLKAQGVPDYSADITEDDDIAAGIPGFDAGETPANSGDTLYDQAVALVARERKASTSFVQRHLQIGYNRAARIVERMEKEGVISAANHAGKREVLVGEP